MAFSLPRIPKSYLDFSSTPLLHHIPQPEAYGTDTIADMYEAKVVLNDVGDMYTKEGLEQTALEAATWTKEASAPYPPAVLLAQAALLAAGDATGIGFYGLTLGLAVLFLASSAWYFLQTRWYLFPLLYLNFWYFGTRFAYVQESSYLVMLIVVMGALFAARHGHRASHLFMGVATTMKLIPVYYARHVIHMDRTTRGLFVGILVAGLLLPYFIWENYLYIYRFADARTNNDWLDVTGALLLVAPLTLVLWYVEEKLAYDTEDRVGWSLVPFGLLTGILTNSGRHMLIALIVPDKRAGRNLAAAAGITLHTLLPGVVRLGSVVYMTTAVLWVVLIYHLSRIGWDVVRADFSQPSRLRRVLFRA